MKKHNAEAAHGANRRGSQPLPLTSIRERRYLRAKRRHDLRSGSPSEQGDGRALDILVDAVPLSGASFRTQEANGEPRHQPGGRRWPASHTEGRTLGNETPVYTFIETRRPPIGLQALGRIPERWCLSCKFMHPTPCCWRRPLPGRRGRVRRRVRGRNKPEAGNVRLTSGPMPPGALDTPTKSLCRTGQLRVHITK